jgi:hypothetical protein
MTECFTVMCLVLDDGDGAICSHLSTRQFRDVKRLYLSGPYSEWKHGLAYLFSRQQTQ